MKPELKAARVGAEPNDKKLSAVCHVNKEKINTVSVSDYGPCHSILFFVALILSFRFSLCYS